MDVFFHGAAGALVASALGERRKGMLVLAGVLGMLPDLAWVGGKWVGMPHMRPLTHSLWFAGLALVIVTAVNWRIAFALPLHILVDLPLHSSSGFSQALHLPAIDWWRGYGLVIASALWVVLVMLTFWHVSRLRAAQLAPAGQTG